VVIIILIAIASIALYSNRGGDVGLSPRDKQQGELADRLYSGWLDGEFIPTPSSAVLLTCTMTRGEASYCSDGTGNEPGVTNCDQAREAAIAAASCDGSCTMDGEPAVTGFSGGDEDSFCCSYTATPTCKFT
jgi:hypothetical protein